MYEGDSRAVASNNQWWRWPVMPLACVAGAFAGSFALTAIQWLGMKFQGGFATDGWYYLYVLPLISAGAFGFIYAWLACYIAPQGKVIAGTVMTTILSIIMAFGVLVVWLSPNISIGNQIQQSLATIAMIAGAVVALVQAHEEHG